MVLPGTNPPELPHFFLERNQCLLHLLDEDLLLLLQFVEVASHQVVCLDVDTLDLLLNLRVLEVQLVGVLALQGLLLAHELREVLETFADAVERHLVLEVGILLF